VTASLDDTPYSKQTQRAARAGDPEAQHAIAVAYATGDEGVRRNLRQARHWYGLAAGRGHEEAAFNYAAMLLAGEGGPRDEAGAMKWMRKASSEGSTSADVYLGDRLARPECRSLAHARQSARHYSRAALRGDIRGLRGLLDLCAQQAGRFNTTVRKAVG
jgi:TPR repeat protein